MKITKRSLKSPTLEIINNVTQKPIDPSLAFKVQMELNVLTIEVDDKCKYPELQTPISQMRLGQ